MEEQKRPTMKELRPYTRWEDLENCPVIHQNYEQLDTANAQDFGAFKRNDTFEFIGASDESIITREQGHLFINIVDPIGAIVNSTEYSVNAPAQLSGAATNRLNSTEFFEPRTVDSHLPIPRQQTLSEHLWGERQEIGPTRDDSETIKLLFESIEEQSHVARAEALHPTRVRTYSYSTPKRTDQIRHWIQKKSLQARNAIDTVTERLTNNPRKTVAILGGIATIGLIGYVGYKIGTNAIGSHSADLIATAAPKGATGSTITDTITSLPAPTIKSPDKIQQWYDVYHQHNPNMFSQEFRNTVTTDEFIDSWHRFFATPA